MKKCVKCGIQKDLEEFHNNKSSKDGKVNKCKPCANKDARGHRAENIIKYRQYDELRRNDPNYKKRVSSYSKEYRKKNKLSIQRKNKEKYKNTNIPENLDESILQRCWKCKKTYPAITKYFYKCSKKKYGIDSCCIPCNRENARDFKEKNKEYYKKYYKSYAKSNKKSISDRHKTREKEDILYRSSNKIRKLINKSLKGSVKESKCELILGVNLVDLKVHLISTFESLYKVTWEDRFMDFLHIDHITPLSQATNIESIYQLNYYTNLQLLYSKDNLQKNSNINWKLDLTQTEFYDKVGVGICHKEKMPEHLVKLEKT